MTEIQNIPLSKIHASKLQMRHWMNAEKLERHTKSMRDQGQERPIKVRTHPDIEGDFEITYGHRTVAALLKAEKATVQAIVEEMTDEQVMLSQRAENREKEDVSDYDMAIWYKMMIDRFGYTQEKLAEVDGVSQSVVANHLRILKIEDSISREIIYRITERQVRAILEAPPELLSDICREIERFDRENGFIPSTSAITDIVAYVQIHKEGREVQPIEEQEEVREAERSSIEEEEKEYLTSRFSGHPLLMSQDDEFETYDFAQQFGLTMEEAAKRINRFRHERRRTLSSEQDKIERPPKRGIQVVEEEEPKQTWLGDAWHPETDQPPALVSPDNSPKAILERYAGRFGVEDQFLLYALQEEAGLSLEEAKKELSEWKLSRPREAKKEVIPDSGFRFKPKPEEEDSVSKLGKYYPYEIIDEVLKRLPNSTFETLLKYCRSFVSTLYSKASLDLRQAVLEEFIR